MFTPFAFIKKQVSAAIAAAQRVLLAGPFISFNSTIVTNGIKLKNSNSEIDPTFNVGSGANNIIFNSAVDENGKIVIGGNFTAYSGSAAANRLARINTNGTLDTSFNVGSGINGGSNQTVYTTLPLTESKVLIGGDFTIYSGSSGTTANYIARLNTNGTIDTTFKGYTNNAVYTSATQSDGKIIIGGAFTSLGYLTPAIAKLTTQGNLDYTFNAGAGANSNVYTFATQSDGKILIGGLFTSYSGSVANRLARINTNGTLDTTFNAGTGFSSGEVDVIKVQPDGKILVGGSFITYSGSTTNRIVRVNTNGTVDTTFNIGTGFNNGQVYDLQLQSDGKIVAVGTWTLTYSGSSAIRIARINPSGSLDTTFNSGTTGFNANQYSCQIQNDGKIIVVGLSATYSGSAVQRIRRINTNGTLDTTFNIGTAGLNNTANVARIQPDQKIVVIGSFTSYSGSAAGVVTRIVRINTDGTRDTTFNPGTTGFNTLTAIPSALELDSSGNIYAGSSFTTYSGSSVNYIVKINPSGSINAGIRTGGTEGVNSNVNALLVDNTQNVYAGGGFFNYVSSISRIARLNTDGGRDYTFNPSGVGFEGGSFVYNLKVQPDNKIVVGGSFTTYSGSAANYIVRINTDGTRDTTFNQGTGFNGNVYKVALENTGKILALGNINGYSGSFSLGKLVRLNISGTLDNTFSTNTYLPVDGQNGDLLIDNSSSIHVVPSTGYGPGYSKLSQSGSYDYNTVIANSTTIRSLTADNSGNVIMLGNNFSASINTNSAIIAFNNSSNTPSSLFNPGTAFFNRIRSSLNSSATGYSSRSTKTPAGDIWLGGSFYTYSGSFVGAINSPSVIKINQQGNLIAVATSSNFDFTDNIYSLQLQSDGKLLVGMAGQNGNSPNPVRVNSNGSPDTSFVADIWLGAIFTMQVQSTGKILIGGEFGYPTNDGDGGYIATNPFYLVRLDSSGSLDGTFPTDQTNGPVYTINTLANDSSILTGNFSTYATTSSNYIVKINSEGIRDASYNVGIGFGSSVFTSTLQPDGKLIAAGEFTSYSGSTANRIARINTDGTLDTTFNPGSGFNTFSSTLSKIVVDNSGNIHIAGGNFTSYSGSVISGYVKILPNGNLDPTVTSGSFYFNNPYTIELLD
jgi:uncharacterized delta-60 repeat protein